MKRSPVSLDIIAEWSNLTHAFHQAARGKRTRRDVAEFSVDLENQIALLRRDIVSGEIRLGRLRSFRIFDPKPRLIQAPVFQERVLHHALMAYMGPVIDRGLIFDCFACRTGKGPVAAVKRAQQHARRSLWFCQIDIRSYFASIDHQVLMQMLEQRFKNRELLQLLQQIVTSASALTGKGLPIGALTSQYFANLYLSGIDRLVSESTAARGYVRYMDDLVWWGDSRFCVREILEKVQREVEVGLGLEIKTPVKIGRSAAGLQFCGYRIFPRRLLLTRRRKQRYILCRNRAERAYLDEKIDSRSLQSRYACAYGMTVNADARAWRRNQIVRSNVDLRLLEV